MITWHSFYTGYRCGRFNGKRVRPFPAVRAIIEYIKRQIRSKAMIAMLCMQLKKHQVASLVEMYDFRACAYAYILNFNCQKMTSVLLFSLSIVLNITSIDD